MNILLYLMNKSIKCVYKIVINQLIIIKWIKKVDVFIIVANNLNNTIKHVI